MHIDTLLLSCRVIGRTVETALLSFIADLARKQKLKNITGDIIPTKKNEPSQNFYAKHKFTKKSENHWSAQLEENSFACPEWIQIRMGG